MRHFFEIKPAYTFIPLFYLNFACQVPSYGIIKGYFNKHYLVLTIEITKSISNQAQFYVPL